RARSSHRRAGPRPRPSGCPGSQGSPAPVLPRSTTTSFSFVSLFATVARAAAPLAGRRARGCGNPRRGSTARAGARAGSEPSEPVRAWSPRMPENWSSPWRAAAAGVPAPEKEGGAAGRGSVPRLGAGEGAHALGQAGAVRGAAGVHQEHGHRARDQGEQQRAEAALLLLGDLLLRRVEHQG